MRPTTSGRLNSESAWPARELTGYLSGSVPTENLAPRFPIDLIVRDFRHTLGATEPGASPITASALAEFNKAIAAWLRVIVAPYIAKIRSLPVPSSRFALSTGPTPSNSWNEATSTSP